MQAPKPKNPLELRKVKTPNELAREHLAAIQVLSGQHLHMTEQSIQSTVQNLREIVEGKDIYTDGLVQRASQILSQLEENLLALRNTHGWPKAPAATAPTPAASQQP